MVAQRVLISIDSHRREYLAIRLLQTELEAAGFVVELCSRYVLRHAYNRFRPDVVIVHSIHKIPELAEIHSQAHVVLLQAESCTGNAEAILALASPQVFDARPDYVDLRYCWGPFDYELLQHHKDTFPNADFALTGHPICDQWYRRRGEGHSSQKLRIGITTSLRTTTHIAGGIKNPVKLVQDVEANGPSGYFDPPQHAEAWFAFETAWIRIVGDLVRAFHKEHEVFLRPHPLENVAHYEACFGALPNVKVGNREDIMGWLEGIDVLVSFLSGSQLDAYVRGVKVISIRNLFPDYVRDRIPKMLFLEHDNHYPAPERMDELLEMVKQKEYHSIPEIEVFLKRVFNYPSKERPSVLIAKHLKSYFAANVKQKAPFRKLKEGHPFRLLPNWVRKDDLSLFYRDCKGMITGRENVSLSFCRHRFLRNFQSERLLGEIQREL